MLRDASRFDILAALNDHRVRLGERDNLLIYYTGHCKVDDETRQGYWLPRDAGMDDPGNWIANTQITDIIDTMQARRVMVVADSCYSGTLSLTSVPKISNAASDREREAWLRTLSSKRSRTALTSGRLAPASEQPASGRSAFADAFISVLEDNSGVLGGHGLFDSLSARVVTGSDALKPVYAPIRFTGHEAGDFFFVPNV
jgi:hypothetical protein